MNEPASFTVTTETRIERARLVIPMTDDGETFVIEFNDDIMRHRDAVRALQRCAELMNRGLRSSE